LRLPQLGTDWGGDDRSPAGVADAGSESWEELRPNSVHLFLTLILAEVNRKVEIEASCAGGQFHAKFMFAVNLPAMLTNWRRAKVWT
jgi:hypothetical protein